MAGASSSPASLVGAPTPLPPKPEQLSRSLSQHAPSPYSISPLSPPSLPVLDQRPAPPETNLNIDTSTERYTLVMSLPGFSLDAITLATKHHRQLVIVADSYDEGGGHVERRVTFSHDADLKKTTASFDGQKLTVLVPRRGSAPPGHRAPALPSQDSQQQLQYPTATAMATRI